MQSTTVLTFGAACAIAWIMKRHVLTDQDRRWMVSRLKTSGRLMAGLVLFNVATSFGWTSRDLPHEIRATVTAQTPEIQTVPSASSESGRKLKSVPPQGWRRTNRGWEHVNSWKSPTISMDSLMQTQAAREPVLARDLLTKVSKLSPVTFAVCQVVAILAIAWLAKLVPPKAHEQKKDAAANDRSLVAFSDG